MINKYVIWVALDFEVCIITCVLNQTSMAVESEAVCIYICMYLNIRVRRRRERIFINFLSYLIPRYFQLFHPIIYYYYYSHWDLKLVLDLHVLHKYIIDCLLFPSFSVLHLSFFHKVILLRKFPVMRMFQERCYLWIWFIYPFYWSKSL